MGSRRGIFWAVGGVALLGIAALRAIGDREEGGAYATGVFAGAVLGPLALALLVFWIVVRVRGRGSAWSPWVLVTAAAVGAIVLAADIGERERERDDFAAAAERCVHPRDPFGAPPAGVSYEPPDPAVERALAEAAATAGEDTSTYEIRLVIRRARPVGRLLAAKGFDDDKGRRDFVAGAVDSLRDQSSTEPRVEETDGETFVTWSEGAAVMAPKGCKMVAVYAPSAEDARYLAEAVFPD